MQTDYSQSIDEKANTQRMNKPSLLDLTAQIVASHLSRTGLSTDEIPQFIEIIHTKLKELSGKDAAKPIQAPALPVVRSKRRFHFLP